MLVEGGGCGPIVDGRAFWLRVEEQVPEPGAEAWAGDGAAASPLMQSRLRPPQGALCPAILGTLGRCPPLACMLEPASHGSSPGLKARSSVFD